MLAALADTFKDIKHAGFSLDGDGDQNGALLIHGFPGTPAEVRPLATMLNNRGWSIEAPLLPGFGAEIANLANRKVDDWLEATTNAYEDLARRTSYRVIIGYSMGGALSMLLAQKLKPDALVLLAPFVKVDHFLWHALPVLRVFFPTIKPFRLFKPDWNDPNMREGIRNFSPDIDLDDPSIRAQIQEFEVPIRMFDQIRILGNRAQQVATTLHTPTLVIQGKQDDLVKEATTAQLLQRFPQRPHYITVDAAHDLLSQDQAAWDTIEVQIVRFMDNQRETAK